jgi:hypothetical protein
MPLDDGCQPGRKTGGRRLHHEQMGAGGIPTNPIVIRTNHSVGA